MHSNRTIANALATTFLTGGLNHERLLECGQRLFGRRWRWMRGLVNDIVTEFGGQVRPTRSMLSDYICASETFQRAAAKHRLRLQNLIPGEPAMAPIPVARSWQLPPLHTPADLAAWLGIRVRELDWFADLRNLNYQSKFQSLRHYRFRPLTDRPEKIRLIEIPKPRLKSIQRQILTEILDRLEPHEAVHGFRRGRSARTFAARHIGKQIVLRIDLADFFPSIAHYRVAAMFRAVGYPERVAQLLTGLCTNTCPSDSWCDATSSAAHARLAAARQMYERRHLPQGAPTSPAIANQCAFRLDCRLDGLAQSAGAVYSRYADDLAFSGNQDFARGAKRFQIHVAATVMEEGFRVQHRKTKIMRRAVRQRLAGLVVNQRVNVSRNDFDRLKAVLNNCIRNGAATQNRDNHPDFRAHLLGRVAFVQGINPDRGAKLRALFDRIDW